jgi:hypothetical protein
VRDTLLAGDVKLVMVSIGKPEIGKDLVAHLELQDGDQFLFVDPENSLYDQLDLNRGVAETFFSPSTPLALLDRLTKKDGMKDLLEVLSKWNKAFYLPPKRDQAFNQGGTFIFNDDKTVFAHYDESTAAHAKIDEVVDLALKTAAAAGESLTVA